MYRVLIVLLSIFSIMDIYSQGKSTDRQPVAAGSYYEANKDILQRDIAGHFKNCVKSPENWKVRAIISPHAGYVFSGTIAASAISAIPEDAEIENILLIGSSHVMAFDGASVYNIGDFITPLGKAEVNNDIANKLKNETRVFNFPVTAHLREHSLEAQIPLIQYYF